ncbi:MAG: hypothetical protein L3K24_14955 [Gammaproteobacteria bacterium]|nr:hypothetical protein [Gammaproteobacteria bacterium]
MKLQYLGDSKDSFKWDYHDFLVSELEYPLLNIALMMTPDDDGNNGKTHPSLFPARNEVIEFCQYLRENRSVNSIKVLPGITGGSYQVQLHNNSTNIVNSNRKEYFSGLNGAGNQVLFLDPDNGFEPEKSINEKHVGYNDISNILEQVSENTVISVFQHHRRKSFPDDFARIKQRLKTGYTTAIYWHALMFVAISKSEETIMKVASITQPLWTESP